jgi:D-glycero-D-manno-heptose 1,7-bisphosphate phosphatase
MSNEAKINAVFLDRDGTLMHDVDYCGDPKDVDLFDGVPEALNRLKRSGYQLIVITNQSGIARGYFGEVEYRAVETELSRQIGDTVIDATYHCPHLPGDGCQCRKPAPEMVLQAARDRDIDLTRSFFVGDKQSDIECGHNAGVRTILVRTGYGQETDGKLADFVAKDLNDAVDIILEATR